MEKRNSCLNWKQSLGMSHSPSPRQVSVSSFTHGISQRGSRHDSRADLGVFRPGFFLTSPPSIPGRELTKPSWTKNSMTLNTCRFHIGRITGGKSAFRHPRSTFSFMTSTPFALLGFILRGIRPERLGSLNRKNESRNKPGKRRTARALFAFSPLE